MTELHVGEFNGLIARPQARLEEQLEEKKAAENRDERDVLHDRKRLGRLGGAYSVDARDSATMQLAMAAGWFARQGRYRESLDHWADVLQQYDHLRKCVLNPDMMGDALKCIAYPNATEKAVEIAKAMIVASRGDVTIAGQKVNVKGNLEAWLRVCTEENQSRHFHVPAAEDMNHLLKEIPEGVLMDLDFKYIPEPCEANWAPLVVVGLLEVLLAMLHPEGVGAEEVHGAADEGGVLHSLSAVWKHLLPENLTHPTYAAYILLSMRELFIAWGAMSSVELRGTWWHRGGVTIIGMLLSRLAQVSPVVMESSKYDETRKLFISLSEKVNIEREDWGQLKNAKWAQTTTGLPTSTNTNNTKMRGGVSSVTKNSKAGQAMSGSSFRSNQSGSDVMDTKVTKRLQARPGKKDNLSNFNKGAARPQATDAEPGADEEEKPLESHMGRATLSGHPLPSYMGASPSKRRIKDQLISAGVSNRMLSLEAKLEARLATAHHNMINSGTASTNDRVVKAAVQRVAKRGSAAGGLSGH
ncbi:unnamed protein product [Pedinophyceae sp. YPF-701]|nr:unnamed protein product [Pedinophyceae sp. YPF-701]